MIIQFLFSPPGGLTPQISFILRLSKKDSTQQINDLIHSEGHLGPFLLIKFQFILESRNQEIQFKILGQQKFNTLTTTYELDATSRDFVLAFPQAELDADICMESSYGFTNDIEGLVILRLKKNVQNWREHNIIHLCFGKY